MHVNEFTQEFKGLEVYTFQRNWNEVLWMLRYRQKLIKMRTQEQKQFAGPCAARGSGQAQSLVYPGGRTRTGGGAHVTSDAVATNVLVATQVNLVD